MKTYIWSFTAEPKPERLDKSFTQTGMWSCQATDFEDAHKQAKEYFIENNQFKFHFTLQFIDK